MFAFTRRLAALDPGRGTSVLLRRVADRPGEADRLLAVFAGVEPAGRYFGPANLARVLGWRGLLELAWRRRSPTR
jgi:hypothetical protein